MLFDAHNHLQDDRLSPWRAEILRTLPQTGLNEAVVNGSAEDDWESVAQLARAHPWLKPSFGLHPWYVKDRSAHWQVRLQEFLAEFPHAAIGEIGLDRWIDNPDIPAQLECFRWQLALAAEQDRPATIHCLRAWGMLEEVLKSSDLPRRGFLLHSYGGPAEMVPLFVKLGAYFSLSPYFGHSRKAAQLATFAIIPPDRLLAETDAPDMWPPEELNDHPLALEGKPLNHPANLTTSYQLLADARGVQLDELREQVAANYRRLFGS